MKRASTILFDLDGTLADGGRGILDSLAYALRVAGVPVPPEATLRSFVGPPFSVTFGQRLGLDPETAARAVAAYRERYVTEGAMLEATPFPGVPELLRSLEDAGRRLAVATSKPEQLARRLLQHLGIESYFVDVVGAGEGGEGAVKAAVISEAARRLRLDGDRATMVGDREDDVIGARAQGIACIGVLWGYGTRDELQAAGADALVSSAEELGQVLLDGSVGGDGQGKGGCLA